MANTLRIKRRVADAAAPTTLTNAELAYNEVGDILYYGKGTGGAGGSATTVEAIGGAGAYLKLSGAQTVSGDKVFNGVVTFGGSGVTSPVAVTQSTGDNSTRLATTAFIKAQNYLTANQTITLTGDVTGSGNGSFAATIASASVTLAKMANLAPNSIIGNNTGYAATPLALTTTQVKTLLAIAQSDVTGLTTASSPTFAGLTLTAALTVANGGTGAATLTGYVKGSGTAALTASATIPNTDITGLGTMSTQAASSVAITGGNIDGTVIGATTRAAGTFTSVICGNSSQFVVNVIGNMTSQGWIQINGTGSNFANSVSFSQGLQINASTGAAPSITLVTGTLMGTAATGGLEFSGGVLYFTPSGTRRALAYADTYGTIATQAANNVTITGGTINGTSVGATTASTGQFTSITLTTQANAVAMNSQKITGLADPTGAQDAATKNYVDSVAAGLDPKGSCRAATTANVTLAGGAPTVVDGVTLVVNNRVLVKNQSAGAQNGIYYVATLGTGADGTWTRATDADTSAEITTGMFTFIEEGTTQASSGWVQTTANPVTLGTTVLVFAQFSGAGSYTAGNGLVLSSGAFSVVGTANRISVSGSGVDISSAYVGQVTITTLGTVTAGTWQSTAISTTYGGTGMNNSSLVADKFLYTSGTGVFTSADITSFGRSILDDAGAGNVRTTLGLGTISTQNANAVAITGGNIDGTPIGATTRSTGRFDTVDLGAGSATGAYSIFISSSLTFATGLQAIYSNPEMILVGNTQLAMNTRIGGSLNIGATTGGQYNGITINNPSLTGAGSLNQQNQLYIDTPTRGTSNYAIYCAGGRVYSAGDIWTSGVIRAGSALIALTDSSGRILSNALNTVAVAQGGTGAVTLTGYVKGSGTAAMTASATIPSGDITGLGTISTQNANNVTITGGSIDGTSIGGGTRGAGYFTLMNCSSECIIIGANANPPNVGINNQLLHGAQNWWINAGGTANARVLETTWGTTADTYSIKLFNDTFTTGLSVFNFTVTTAGASAMNWYIANSAVMSLSSTGLNSTAIGATTASTGRFTTVNATTSVTIASLAGVLKATAGLISVAVDGTDYLSPNATIDGGTF